MSDVSNTALDTAKTPINPKGRGGWVVVAVMFLTAWEGFAAVGHHDPIDPPGVNTVCFGHIENVKIGERHTKIQCQEMLAEDLPRYEKQLERCIHVPMPGYRHAAILSFTYNVGGGALCKSSVARYINAGEWQKGCDALLLYDRANGRVIKGLENRRKAERKMCYNVDEPPLPNAEVAALAHENVDSGMKASPLAKNPEPPLPPQRPVTAPAPAPTSSRVLHWLMEK